MRGSRCRTERRGINFVEKRIGLTNLLPGISGLIPYLDNALRARLYRRDKDYIVRNSEVIIVDGFTGRLMEGRRYSKVCIKPIEAGRRKGSERIGDAGNRHLPELLPHVQQTGWHDWYGKTEEEFQKIYSLDVVQIQPIGGRAQRRTRLVYRSEAQNSRLCSTKLSSQQTPATDPPGYHRSGDQRSVSEMLSARCRASGAQRQKPRT